MEISRFTDRQTQLAARWLIVTSWLQGTSRDGDPRDHVHNQIARPDADRAAWRRPWVRLRR